MIPAIPVTTNNGPSLKAVKGILPPREAKHPTRVTGLHKHIIWAMIRLRILVLVLKKIRSVKKALQMHRHMLSLRENVWGGKMTKLYKVDGKYFYNQYTAPWPSRQYDQFINQEIERWSFNRFDHATSFIFLAVTSKCPLRCEHCLEAANLNKPETFTAEELEKIIAHFRRKGVLQMHLSGGETMLRVKDLIPIIRNNSKEINFWILTSGFNCTTDNLNALKEAGLTGLVVSIDHHIPAMHDLFRQKPGSFDEAVAAVQMAKGVGLAVAVSICATKTFIDDDHLEPYAGFAASLNVEFVQILEPKNVGNYKDKDVLLEQRHIDRLEAFFKKINLDPLYSNYPSFSYHGYHQRRMGCFAGSRSMYIDAAGNVHACPFCHTSAYNISAFIKEDKLEQIPSKQNKCPRFEKVI